MNRSRILLMINRMLGTATLLALAGAPSVASGEDSPCNVESVAGNWMFFTEIGQQQFIPDQDGDITALGTMNIDAEGNVSGIFDNNVAELASTTDIPYGGSFTVEPDCRGTITFVTGSGFVRTDSVAVLSRDEMRGMSQRVDNLWTYEIRRISMASGPDTLEAKVDAIMRRLGLLPAAFEEDDD